MPPTPAGAWADFNRAANGERSTTACNATGPWTDSGVNAGGAFWLSAQGTRQSWTTCNQQKPLACCSAR
ncbi:MAG: hypothetical protein SFW67_35165 [Myxococcaceae bacterium]|nr:hypothetical protein [Myxococcaceae bacterium]